MARKASIGKRLADVSDNIAEFKNIDEQDGTIGFKL